MEMGTSKLLKCTQTANKLSLCSKVETLLPADRVSSCMAIKEASSNPILEEGIKRGPADRCTSAQSVQCQADVALTKN